MQQAAAATGIPLSAFKAAKRGGCRAFDHSRVHLAAFLAWWFAQGGDTNDDWRGRYERARAMREEVKLEEDKKRTIDRGAVSDAIAAAVAAWRSAADRIFCSELPAVLKGADEKSIKARCKHELENLYAELRERFQRLDEKGAKE
jgi:hypothetical protein